MYNQAISKNLSIGFIQYGLHLFSALHVFCQQEVHSEWPVSANESRFIYNSCMYTTSNFKR